MSSHAARAHAPTRITLLAGVACASLLAAHAAEAQQPPQPVVTYVASDDRDSIFSVRCRDGRATQMIVRAPASAGGEPEGCFRPPRNVLVCETDIDFAELALRACAAAGEAPSQ